MTLMMIRLRERLLSIIYAPSEYFEAALLLILFFRGVFGLRHAPIAARRLEYAWLLWVYIGIALVQLLALITWNRTARRLCALAQTVVWTTIAVQLYLIDSEITSSFQVFAIFSAWLAIRLDPKERG